jgi:hypothetical protein
MLTWVLFRLCELRGPLGEIDTDPVFQSRGAEEESFHDHLKRQELSLSLLLRPRSVTECANTPSWGRHQVQSGARAKPSSVEAIHPPIPISRNHALRGCDKPDLERQAQLQSCLIQPYTSAGLTVSGLIVGSPCIPRSGLG